jgi:hypothetical protein
MRLPDPGALRSPDWLYEVNFDDFRALAHVNGHHGQLMSHNKHADKIVDYANNKPPRHRGHQ